MFAGNVGGHRQVDPRALVDSTNRQPNLSRYAGTQAWPNQVLYTGKQDQQNQARYAAMQIQPNQVCYKSTQNQPNQAQYAVTQDRPSCQYANRPQINGAQPSVVDNGSQRVSNTMPHDAAFSYPTQTIPNGVAGTGVGLSMPMQPAVTGHSRPIIPRSDIIAGK